jgi:hypothetical protein
VPGKNESDVKDSMLAQRLLAIRATLPFFPSAFPPACPSAQIRQNRSLEHYFDSLFRERTNVRVNALKTTIYKGDS